MQAIEKIIVQTKFGFLLTYSYIVTLHFHNSLLIHCFCAKVVNQIVTYKQFDKSQENPGSLNSCVMAFIKRCVKMCYVVNYLEDNS